MNVALEKFLEELRQREERFKCSHVSLDIRKRKVKGGNIQYVKQCLICGNAMPQPIKQEVALGLNNGIEPLAFDENKQIDWKAKKEKSYSEINDRYQASKSVEVAQHSEWYRAYLQTPDWKLKREKVFARAKNICEGCLDKTASEVHHISYENIGDELLYQLVALCEACHKKAHSNDLNVINVDD